MHPLPTRRTPKSIDIIDRSRRCDGVTSSIHFSLDWLATSAMLIVTVVLCARWGIDPNTDWLVYARVLMAVTLLASSATFLLLFARQLFIWTVDRNASTPTDSRFVVYSGLARSLLLLFAVSWIYSHVKTGVLLGETHDDLLRKLDHLVLGNDGWVLARSIIPRSFAGPLYWVYMLFKPVIVTMIFWLSLTGSAAQARKLTTGILIGYFIGVFAYFAIPTYGPAFIYETASCEWLSPATHKVQMLLTDATAEVQKSPALANVLPWKYIAAFPSLHLSHVIILAWFLRGRPLTFLIANVFVVVTAISTIYLGWHYVADLFGGIAVAGLAIWITERFSEIEIPLPRFATSGVAKS